MYTKLLALKNKIESREQHGKNKNKTKKQNSSTYISHMIYCTYINYTLYT